MKTRLSLFIFLCIVVMIPVLGQGAPDPINDALADLSQRVGISLTLNDLYWTWEQVNFADGSLDCPQPGQSYTQAQVVGYKFTFRYAGQVYDYRVSADRSTVVLCSVAAEGEEATITPPEGDPDQPEYSNPLCGPAPDDLTYMRTRLAVSLQARVGGGLPNNLRAQPATTAALIGEIPGGAFFNVIGGPQCDEQGYIWWEVDFDGLVGWTVEGRNGEYFLEPVPAAPLPVSRPVIDYENAAQLNEVARLEANFGESAIFGLPDAAGGNANALLVTGGLGSEGVFVYDLNLLEQAPRLLAVDYGVSRMAFGLDPNIVLLGGRDGSIRLWDLRPTAPLLERAYLLGHDTSVTALAYSADGSTIASSGGVAFLGQQSDDNRYAIVLWDVETVSQRAGLRGHSDTVTGVAFDAAGQVVYSASLDQTFWRWDMTTGQGMPLLEADSAIVSMAFDAATNRAALGLSSGGVLLVQAETGQIIATLTGHSTPVVAVEFSPDGSALVTAGEDGLLNVWNANDPTQAQRIVAIGTAPVLDLAFSPDGSLLTVLDEEQMLRFLVAAVVAVG